ncbi:hypothetical protein G6M89_11855 [Natronolimnobius sp. AArcel1]|uniref:HalOD1 output domain-containing protein n=1 Tax=Natronolimnobius sp. AArcel1 TaxID=1679093 RepID=UPI0013ED106A|nr:HalOD1 output domain-containing protein [Natronolimnobius sp. AArcel1]NGM69693.1 hypothetical protein [Natronolimnobius sp. AArcel1]
MPDTIPRRTDRFETIETALGHSLHYDPDRETYHCWYDSTDGEPISTTVVVAVATLLETTVADLEALYSCIDADALNTLCAHWMADTRITEGTIEFTYAGCRVMITAAGAIVIEPVEMTGQMG